MKSMMKHIWAMLLCMALVLSLCACGKEEEPDEVIDEPVDFHALYVSLPGNISSLDPLDASGQRIQTGDVPG